MYGKIDTEYFCNLDNRREFSADFNPYPIKDSSQYWGNYTNVRYGCPCVKHRLGNDKEFFRRSKWRPLIKTHISNGSVRYLYLCLYCNLSSDGVPQRLTARMYYSVFDSMDELSDELRSHIGKAWREDRELRYKAYLNSKTWKHKRELVIDRDQECMICHKGESDNWNVHHISYSNLGREQPFDIILLCGTCHEKIHSYSEHIKWKMEYRIITTMKRWDECIQRIKDINQRIIESSETRTLDNPTKTSSDGSSSQDAS